jgi:uncharacterized membrane protein
MILPVIVISLVFVFAGLLLWKKTPKKINGLYGYRTNRSMKNAITWKEGNEYAGKLMFITGIASLFFGSAIIFMLPNPVVIIAVLLLTAVSSIFVIVRTEQHLKKFEKEKTVIQ